MPDITEVYQGQFGQFTITDEDRREVMIYRGGLIISAISLALAINLVLFANLTPPIISLIIGLYALFSLGLGVSLMTIHIYFRPLHLLLKLFWMIGTIASFILILRHPENSVLWVYQHPLSLLGIGFTFAALTGIYFKEAFCFNQLEMKVLTPLVPLLLLGHLVGILPLGAEQVLLFIWSILFVIVSLRKFWQPIPEDIGDKSVFDYLKNRQSASSLL